MRACTAVVTEISWNDSEDDSSKYRAEIHFISPEEWKRELVVLFDEIVDSEGKISHECFNEDSDASAAYAKIRAVYHKHTKGNFPSTVSTSNDFPDSLKLLFKIRHVARVNPGGSHARTTCTKSARKRQTFEICRCRRVLQKASILRRFQGESRICKVY